MAISDKNTVYDTIKKQQEANRAANDTKLRQRQEEQEREEQRRQEEQKRHIQGPMPSVTVVHHERKILFKDKVLWFFVGFITFPVVFICGAFIYSFILKK